MEDFLDYIESEESLIESANGFKILSETPDRSTEFYALLGFVVPLSIFLTVFFAARRVHPPRKENDTKTSGKNPLLANKQRRLRVVILTILVVLIVVFGFTGVVIWAIARTHPERMGT